jgi:hypothetical protein
MRYRQIFTALEIATLTEDFDTWKVDDENSLLIETARQAHYSFLPVERDGEIVGIGTTDALADDPPRWEPLTAEWLVAGNTSILDLIGVFAERPEQVFFVLDGSRIAGLVAPADLNKVPARASIYLLIGELESKLASLIKQEMSEEAYCAELTDNRVEVAEDRQQQAASDDLDLELIHYMDFFDILTIVRKNDRLAEMLDGPSKREMGGINEVRNAVSHQVNDLVSSREDLQDLLEVCQRASHWNLLVANHLHIPV